MTQKIGPREQQLRDMRAARIVAKRIVEEADYVIKTAQEHIKAARVIKRKAKKAVKRKTRKPRK